MKHFSICRLCLVLTALSITAQAQIKNVMPLQTVRDFAAAINGHDPEKIAALMSDDHQFVDAQNNIISGRDKMKAGWAGYFQWFPDYRIELTDLFANTDTVAAFGFASGTYKGLKTAGNGNYWRLPASWKAVVVQGKIKIWQVFADTKIPFEIIAKNTHPAEAAALPTGRIVTSIGGIFFKCTDPKKQREWYKQHLGLNTNQYGAVFEWRQGLDSTKKGFTQWSPFSEKTKYFAPSTKEFMINYRVVDMETLVAALKKDGVNVVDEIASYDYGKFVHLMDPEGNKIELWEPNDIVYEKMGSGTVK